MITLKQTGNDYIIFEIEEALKYLNERAEDMVEMAKDKAPVAKEPYPEYRKGKKIMRRPGRLKKSIKKKDFKKSIKVYVDMTQKGAPYAFYQETGFQHHITGKIYPGKHFMEEALDVVLTEMENDGLEVANKCLKMLPSNGKPLKVYR